MDLIEKLTKDFTASKLEINERHGRYSLNEDDIKELDQENIAKIFKESFKHFLLKSESSEEDTYERKYKNFDIKEQIVLNSLTILKENSSNDNPEIIFLASKEKIKTDSNFEIYNQINKIVHKSLHKKKYINDKISYKCVFNEELINDNSTLTIDNIDKVISDLKISNKNIEFIAIKTIMICITDFTSELLKNYLNNMEELKSNNISEENNENNELNEDNTKDVNVFDLNIFEDIYKNFLTACTLCSSKLEEYFKSSFSCFHEKYQLNFTLSELFTDIFWNCIFQNKEMCSMFINTYIDDICCDVKSTLKKIVKIIFNVNIPLKHQIVELLEFKQIENKEKYDLMTLIVNEKNKRHHEIVKAERQKELNKEKHKSKSEFHENKAEVKKNNLENHNNIENNNNKKTIVEDNKQEFNIITANDISTIKHNNSKMKTINNNKSDENITSNSIINNNDNSNNEFNKNGNKELQNNENKFIDLEHKSVDEVYNYINEDKIVKNRKKRKAKKNKKNKIEEIKNEEIKNEEKEVEDLIVVKFKEDLQNSMIHSNEVRKIKPVISESWIKVISTYN